MLIRINYSNGDTVFVRSLRAAVITLETKLADGMIPSSIYRVDHDNSRVLSQYKCSWKCTLEEI